MGLLRRELEGEERFFLFFGVKQGVYVALFEML